MEKTENIIAMQEHLYADLLYYFDKNKVSAIERKIIMEGIYNKFLTNAYTQLVLQEMPYPNNSDDAIKEVMKKTKASNE